MPMAADGVNEIPGTPWEMPRTPSNGGAGGLNPSPERSAMIVFATVSPQLIPFWIDFALSKPLRAITAASRFAFKLVACKGYWFTSTAYAASIAAARRDAGFDASGATSSG